MQASYIRYQFDLCSTKKITLLFVIFLLMVSLPSEAQLLVKRKDSYKSNNKVNSFRGVDKGRIRDYRFMTYGFYLGVHQSRLGLTYDKLTNLSNLNPNTNPESIINGSEEITFITNNNLGFLLGFLINFRIDENWDIRFQPGAGFYQHSIDFSYNLDTTTNYTETATSEQVMIEFPILVKYKSQKRGRSGMYMIAGVKPAFNISPAPEPIELDLTNTENSEGLVLPLNSFDFSLELGFGMDTHFKYFKLSPELRFSYGLLNRQGDQNSVFDLAFSRINNKSLSLIFHFQ